MQILLFGKHCFSTRSEHKISFIHRRTLKWKFRTLSTFYLNIFKDGNNLPLTKRTSDKKIKYILLDVEFIYLRIRVSL